MKILERYALYDAIASGGMATVHLGRLLGPVGFARTVAIKRLHEHLSSDPEFTAMFLEEARLTTRIQHANVVATLDVVMSYFGYSMMERAIKQGEVVTAKTRARLFSSIPICDAGVRIFFFDLHIDGIEFYFADTHVTHHLYGAPVVTQAIRDLVGDRPYVLGATDVGRAKWVESLARTLGVDPAFVYKCRDPKMGEVSLIGVNADVRGKDVVLYDDMIRTGSSFI